MAKATERQMAAFKKLGYTDEQIEEMLEDDKAVDRGEALPWDMSREEHKKAMKYANADEHKKPAEKKAPTVYKFDNTSKPRKENATKAQIIKAISQFIEKNDDIAFENVQVTNAERVIEFNIGGISYSITLTQHRKAK